MPVLRDWELAPRRRQVLWGQGPIRRSYVLVAPKLAVAAEEVIERGRPLLAPVVLFQRIPVVGLRHERLSLAGGGILFGSLIASHLATTSEVIGRRVHGRRRSCEHNLRAVSDRSGAGPCI